LTGTADVPCQPTPALIVEGQHPEICGHCRKSAPCHRHLFVHRYDTEVFVPLCDPCSAELDSLVMEFTATGRLIRLSAT
jgi:hypothetical protein